MVISWQNSKCANLYQTLISQFCRKYEGVFFIPQLVCILHFHPFSLTPIDDRGIFIEDHIPKRPDRSLTGSRFLSALYGMWSSTEIPLFKLFIFVNFSHIPGSLFKKNLKENKTLINKIAIGQYW